MPCNIFGPHDNFAAGVSHVIPGMISRLYACMHDDDDDNDKAPEQREFVVFGSGRPLRQFIYSLDLAKLIVWVVRNYESVEPIILSGRRANGRRLRRSAFYPDFCICSQWTNPMR